MEVNSLEKVFSVRCPFHPTNSSDVLLIADIAASHRACINCIIGGDYPPLVALDLRSLF